MGEEQPPGPAARVVQVQVEAALQREVHRDAADQRHDAHQQRQVEAVPDRQVVLGRRRAEHRRGRDVHQRPERQRRRMPTTTHSTTSSATGAFITSGGSCGCGFGRSFGGPLKNTSWMKRSE